jgi:hypothetical protein
MVAGACMVLGLRFAGSANQQARTVLTNRLLYFIKRAKTLVGPVRLEPACGGEPFATTDDTTRHDTTRHTARYRRRSKIARLSVCASTWPRWRWPL